MSQCWPRRPPPLTPPTAWPGQERGCPFCKHSACVLADRRRSWGSALRNTCPTHHIPSYIQAYRPWHSTATCYSGRTPELKEEKGEKLNFTPAKDMRLLCLLHVLWHIHYWECKWKCSSNMLKNSQGAGREELLCFPGLSKGQKALKEWHSLGLERERGRALISCLLLMEVREGEFCQWIWKATSGERGGGGRWGTTGRQARGRGVGAFAVHPAERLCFSQPPSDPADRPELQGNYGNAALKPSIASFQFFLRTKQRQ